MPITVLSPHDGQPVKVRDQDVGRAVRDKQGRILYVLPKKDGSGFYGSMTRAGGAKDEQRAIELEGKLKTLSERREQTVVHDATGKRRQSWRGRLVVGFLFLVVLALLGLYLTGPKGVLETPLWDWHAPPTPGELITPGDTPAPTVPKPAAK